MKKFALVLAFGFLLLSGLKQAHAQAQIELGPRAGLDVGDVEDFFIGADVRIGLGELPVLINPGFNYYFREDDEFVEELTDDEIGVDRGLFTVDVNLLYEFGVDNQVFTPYAGGGLMIARFSADPESELPADADLFDETEVGFNVVGGAAFESGNLKPFVQAKFTLGMDVDLFSVGGGLLFSLGG